MSSADSAPLRVCNVVMCLQDTSIAAANGHLECLKYMHENGCVWNVATSLYAAREGHLECLKYMHENGCKWHPETTFVAAAHGQLECLRYAHENGCAWDGSTTYIAASNGHLECLRYARDSSGVSCEHPTRASCEWHPYTTYGAAMNGQLECLKYIYERCGDIMMWENAELEDEAGVSSEDFSKEVRDYIDSVREDWKCGLNKPGMRTKSAVKGY